MELKEIQALLKQFDESSVREFHLRTDETELQFSKNKVQQQLPTETSTAAVSTPPAAAPAATETTPAPEKPAQPGQMIKAPLVGIVHLQSRPEAPVYKQVGDTVQVGEVVCLIEAMKMMNEIKSDVSGVITAVLVDNDSLVDFHQPLFEVGTAESEA
jgi:acetyl-CoA carboxylase biotin carboxyl carrier protein